MHMAAHRDVITCLPGEDMLFWLAQDLDPDEQHEVLERERLLAEDPAMLAFATAQKKRGGTADAQRGFLGDKAKGITARKQERVLSLIHI